MGDGGPTKEHRGNALLRHIDSKSPKPMPCIEVEMGGRRRCVDQALGDCPPADRHEEEEQREVR